MATTTTPPSAYDEYLQALQTDPSKYDQSSDVGFDPNAYAKDVYKGTGPGIDQTGIEKKLMLGKGLNGADVNRAQLYDYKALQQAQQQSADQYGQGLDVLQTAARTVPTQVNDLSAKAFTDAEGSGYDDFEQKSIAQLDDAKAAYAALPGQAEDKYAESLALAGERRDDALGTIKDMTAQELNSIRSTIDSDLEQRKGQLVDANKRGDIDSDTLQAEMQRLEWDHQTRLGTLRSQIGVSYQKRYEDLLSSYDSNITQLQGLGQQLMQQAATTSASGQLAAAQLAQNTITQSQNWRQMDKARGYELGVAAAQMQGSLASQVAQMWASAPSYFAPIAGIVADAADWQKQYQAELDAKKKPFSFKMVGEMNPWSSMPGYSVSGGGNNGGADYDPLDLGPAPRPGPTDGIGTTPNSEYASHTYEVFPELAGGNDVTMNLPESFNGFRDPLDSLPQYGSGVDDSVGAYGGLPSAGEIDNDPFYFDNDPFRATQQTSKVDPMNTDMPAVSFPSNYPTQPLYRTVQTNGLTPAEATRNYNEIYNNPAMTPEMIAAYEAYGITPGAPLKF